MTKFFGIVMVVGVAVVAAGCQYGDSTSTSTPTSSTPTATSTPTSPTTPTTPTDPGTPTTPAPTPTGLTYSKDIAPIMITDCVRCHGPVVRDGGYDMSTYAGVMRAVSAGNASSKLVKVTLSNGIMYSQLSGNRAQKSTTIHDWVVTWKAQQ